MAPGLFGGLWAAALLVLHAGCCDASLLAAPHDTDVIRSRSNPGEILLVRTTIIGMWH